MQELHPSILKAALDQADRPVRCDVPPGRVERERLREAVRQYVADHRLVPPLTADELARHVPALLEQHEVDPDYRAYAAVLLNNQVWRDTVAGVPYQRRMLLLPQCLRDEDRCRADIDPLGLICKQCGACPIADLQGEAERLGYVVLVAEGSPVVMKLIESGKIDALVGVSCLPTLERVFPYMEASAVPGLAIPLLNDGCSRTALDLDWAYEAIYLNRSDRSRLLDLEALRRQVDDWFTPTGLDQELGPAVTETERIARQWLCRSGKRWRPFLAACVYEALRLDGPQDPAAPADDGTDLRKVALAVECFHKASLVHDDIEDDDATRYGEPALHEQYGVPVALNVGDLLLGQGYQLIAATGAAADRKADMLRVAADGHTSLCLGQGRELCWMRQPGVLTPLEVLHIFRQKTSPAFEVALRLGAILAGAGSEVAAILSQYSEALGIAYQIHDDLEDFQSDQDTNDVQAMRPSILLALAGEQARGDERQLIQQLWRRELDMACHGSAVRDILGRLRIEAVAGQLLSSYKAQAIRCLSQLRSACLKALLRRVVARIFNDIQTLSCCDDYPDRPDPLRRAGD